MTQDAAGGPNPSNPLQGTADWIRERIGCLTASRMADAMDFLKNGNSSAARTKLMRGLLAERLVNAAMDHYVTPAMEWGLAHEAGARDRYEAISGNLVQLVGFVPHRSIEWFGASPDGFIDDDGLVEIKCPTTPAYIAWRTASVVPEEYKPQMLAQLSCTRRKFCDFVAFDPRVKERRLQLFVRRFTPVEAEIAEVEIRAIQFLRELDSMFDAFHAKEAHD